MVQRFSENLTPYTQKRLASHSKLQTSLAPVGRNGALRQLASKQRGLPRPDSKCTLSPLLAVQGSGIHRPLPLEAQLHRMFRGFKLGSQVSQVCFDATINISQ